MARTADKSVNAGALRLVERLLEQTKLLGIASSMLESGVRVIDAGIDVPGSVEAGRLIAEICMGGQGAVRIVPAEGQVPASVGVSAENAVVACLASQYAGWSLSAGEGKQKFHALGSGPARALARKEPLFDELAYRDESRDTVLVLEVNRVPPQEVVSKVLRDTGVNARGLTLILTPTESIAGATQIVSRVLEVGLHKAHALHFPLDQIRQGTGSAPLPPRSLDFMTAMGRTNDAILFGGQVRITVDCDDAAARSLAERLPSSCSRDYGRPFKDVFKHYDYDFYRIDPELFAPAAAEVHNLATGHIFKAGQLDMALLERSFSQAA